MTPFFPGIAFLVPGLPPGGGPGPVCIGGVLALLLANERFTEFLYRKEELPCELVVIIVVVIVAGGDIPGIDRRGYAIVEEFCSHLLCGDDGDNLGIVGDAPVKSGVVNLPQPDRCGVPVR